MSVFDDLTNKHLARINTHDERLRQLQLEEGVHRDALADDQKADVWPSARERLDSIQSEVSRERDARHQAEQDLDGVRAMRDAVQVALATVSPESDREERGPIDDQALDQLRERCVSREQAEAVGQALQEISDPPVMLGQERIDAVPDAALTAAVFVGVAGRSAKSVWAAYGERSAAVQLQATQNAQAIANELEACQRGDLTELKDVVEHEWEVAQTDLGAYGRTPDAPGDYYKNLFDQHVQRVQQTFHLHEQQWAQHGPEAEGELRSKNIRGDIGLSQFVCEQFAAREIGVERVEKPIAEYERVLHDRGIEETGDRLAAYRQTLEESAQPEIAVRAEELRAQYFSELDCGVASPSRAMNEFADRRLDPAHPGPDFVSRDSLGVDR
jgi:hypothetical protein